MSDTSWPRCESYVPDHGTSPCVSIRSRCGPNSDTHVCERGRVGSSLPTPVTQPRHAQTRRGFLIHSRRQLLANAAIAASRVAS
jgi:hypothetical protein